LEEQQSDLVFQCST